MLKSMAATTLLLALLLMATGVANATSITYSTSYSLTQPPWTTSLFLPQFDSSLGTLTGVTITNEGNILGGYGLENRINGQGQTITAYLTANLTITLPNGYGDLVSSPTYTDSHALLAYDGLLNYAGNSGITVTGVSSVASAQYFALPSQLTSFIGLGNLSYTASAADYSFASGTGNLASYFDDIAGINLSIKYDYDNTPVPEPATILLLGSGILGLAYKRRKSVQTNNLEV